MEREPEHIILFDGVCNLCNNSVQFVIRHDKQAIFRFAALQSEAGAHLLQKHGLDPGKISTVVYIHQNKVYQKSAAALHVAGRLGWPWKLLYGFLVIPAFLRNIIYDLVARNRYRWFGRQDHCMVPAPGLLSRFL